MSNLLDARGWRWGGAVWGKGLHENVMLPSDSSCSTGTACFCVNEVNCRLGKERKKRLFGPISQQEVLFLIMFYNVLNIFAHIYLHQGGVM